MLQLKCHWYCALSTEKYNSFTCICSTATVKNTVTSVTATVTVTGADEAGVGIKWI